MAGRRSDERQRGPSGPPSGRTTSATRSATGSSGRPGPSGRGRLGCRPGRGPARGTCSGRRRPSGRRCRDRSRSTHPAAASVNVQRADRRAGRVEDPGRAGDRLVGAHAESVVRSEWPSPLGDMNVGLAARPTTAGRRSTVTTLRDRGAVVRGVRGPDRDPVATVGTTTARVVRAVPREGDRLAGHRSRCERRAGDARRQRLDDPAELDVAGDRRPGPSSCPAARRRWAR